MFILENNLKVDKRGIKANTFCLSFVGKIEEHENRNALYWPQKEMVEAHLSLFYLEGPQVVMQVVDKTN